MSDKTFLVNYVPLWPDFKRLFTVAPSEREGAFIKVTDVDLLVLLSGQHDRIVRGDNTVCFGKLVLQIPRSRERCNYVRCPVLVHELFDGTIGVRFHSRLLAR